MTTEAKQRTDGLGWEHYPKSLTAAERQAITIRPAEQEELAVIHTLRDLLFPKMKPRKGIGIYDKEDTLDRKPTTFHAIALDGEMPIAIGTIFPTTIPTDGSVFKLTSLAVVPQYRRNEVGSTVLSFLEEQAVDLGARSIRLNSTNQAISLYEGAGYRRNPISTTKDIGTPMIKHLTQAVATECLAEPERAITGKI